MDFIKLIYAQLYDLLQRLSPHEYYIISLANLNKLGHFIYADSFFCYLIE